MAKIPVAKTISYAYGFTFRNFLTVLGLAWFPLLISASSFAYRTLVPATEGVAAEFA